MSAAVFLIGCTSEIGSTSDLPQWVISDGGIHQGDGWIPSRFDGVLINSEGGPPPPTHPRGIAGDSYADLVLGQPDFFQGIPGEIVRFKVAGPGGVLVDRNAHPNRVYIFDGQNSRILGFSSLGTCATKPTQHCTSDTDCIGSTCSLGVAGKDSTTLADLVLGQLDFNHAACNGDGAADSYKNSKPPTASTLCSVRPGDPSPFEGGSFATMAVDADGNLYVPDIYNHRVLRYNDPFKTDHVADEVWGQTGFDQGKCNRGGAPTAATLCFDAPGYTAGVHIDAEGNLWVADVGNHRVLRFPKSGASIATTANLVLGQPGFTSRNLGSGLNQLNAPAAVAARPNGKVYVADGWNDRVLIYDPPLTNGKAARVFVSAKYPTGVTPDPSGGIWVSDTHNYQVVLFNESNAAVMKVLIKNSYRPDGICGGQPECASPTGHDRCLMCDSRGSVGITSDGDIIIPASSSFQDVHYYKHPIPAPGGSPYPAAAAFFSPPLGHNYLSDRGFLSPRGLAVTADQLIVADAYRMLFWKLGAKGLASLVTGSAANGIAGVKSFDQYLSDPPFYRIVAAGGSLWTSRLKWLERYNLPLSHGQLPNQTINNRDIRLLGGSAIGKDFEIWGIAADPNGTLLWVALPYHDRVLRLRIPSAATSPMVADVIIGGTDIPAERHDWHRPCPPAAELCAPGSVTLDRAGNIIISNYNTENEGNGKLLLFKASSFPASPASLITLKATDASKTLEGAELWHPAFNSKGTMFAGGAAFTAHQGKVLVAKDIQAQIGPNLVSDEMISDHYTQGITSIVDSFDNVAIADMNRGRVLIYFTPFLNL